MSEKVKDGVVRITESDIRNRYLPFLHVRELFPDDCFGGDDHSKDPGRNIVIHLDNVGSIETDLYRTKKTPRNRRKDTVGAFYERGKAKPGSCIFVEKLGAREFRVTVID